MIYIGIDMKLSGAKIRKMSDRVPSNDTKNLQLSLIIQVSQGEGLSKKAG